MVYGSAQASTLKMLMSLYHLELRLATGAFRISPVIGVYAGGNKWSLERRQMILSTTCLI